MAADRMRAQPIVGFGPQWVHVISTFPVNRIFWSFYRVCTKVRVGEDCIIFKTRMYILLELIPFSKCVCVENKQLPYLGSGSIV